jgi:putative two-component system response regulator
MMERNTAKILIVDDEAFNIDVVVIMLAQEGYEIISTTRAEEALPKAILNQPDLILLDLMMPEVDGYQVIAALKAEPATQQIPIIVMTSMNDRASKLCALHQGAEDFLTKPLDKAELLVRIRNLLRLKKYNDFLNNYALTLENQVQERTLALKTSYIETIHTLARAAEHKDTETGCHIKRIGRYCYELSKSLGLTNEFADTIFYASPMHDVGKIGIPDHILLKKGSHTFEEWIVMQSHTQMGYNILNHEQSTSPFLEMAAQIALSHHERWDGSGYPNKLVGENIPLAARIMAICDIYDALRSQRPYKKAFDHETACQIILHGDERTKPTDFDPEVLSQFMYNTDRFREIFAAYVD